MNGAPLPAQRGPESPAVSMSEELAREFNLSVSPSDVHLLDPPPTVTRPHRQSRAWVLGGHPGERDDLFLARARLTPEGSLLGIEGLYNLTDTQAADEQKLVAASGWAAVTLGDQERDYAIHFFDAERAPALPPALPWLARTQLQLTWWDETGQPSGVSRRIFKLDPPTAGLRLRADADALSIRGPHLAASIPRSGPPTEGGQYLDEVRWHVARPGNLVTWAVDRLRARPWFGDERMQILKVVAYRVLDRLKITLADFVETDQSAPEFSVQAPRTGASPRTERLADERGWPPADLRPVLDPALENEGHWLTLENDPFVTRLPNGSSPFAITFLRTDPDRVFSRIVMLAWDGELVELSVQGGTEEPKTSTGETGTGLIPRDPAVLERLAAAFNGGFQSTHGEFGIMAEGRVLVPPAPFAATVARLSDGRTGFGSWPAEGAIPPEVVAFRQNLTALVQDGKENPYRRLFWGGAPEDWEDRTQTVRSGLCRTTSGHVLYLYGASVDQHELAKAMLLAGCDYGLHLDMNQGHTGLEFYTVGRAETLPTLAMPLDRMWQAEGPVQEAPGFRFRGRRLFRTMQLMNFPRYIQREARDFFYLTLRPTLPGKPLTSSTESSWSRVGLVEESFPHPLLRATFRPEPTTRPETKLHALELDPARLEVTSADDARALFTIAPAGEGDAHLVFAGGHFAISRESPGPQAIVLARGFTSKRPGTVAAFGIRGGFLVYVEVGTGRAPESDATLLEALLRDGGCAEWLFLSAPVPWSLAGGLGLSGHPTNPAPGEVAFREAPTMGAKRIFTETPVVERAVWHPLQRRR